MILPEEWREWKLHPVTVEWFKFLASEKSKVKEEWANSIFVGDSIDLTIQRNAHALGQIDMLKRLEEATVEEIEEDMYDNRE